MSNEILKNNFQQKSMGWCTVYALANIFKDADLLKFTNSEEFKGCGDKEINAMLGETGLVICDVATVTQNYKHFPKDWVYGIIREHIETDLDENIDVIVTPYLLSVTRIPGIYHSVVVLMINGFMLYLDPYDDSWQVIERPEDFEDKFLECQSVQRFCLAKENRYAILRGEVLGYDKVLTYLQNEHVK
ncbi:hypothetical protein JMG10_07630 [Nostoc ellipsosporum NOK]|nr:hypothetical protein [Nostoc ellipsosporum NOK]